MGYYDRTPAVHLDGSLIFRTPEDAAVEGEVAHLLSRAWQCEIRAFGALSPIDWYGERHGRLVGVLELKARSHDREKYPTVFLSVRKWLALLLASQGLGIPGLFVVKFMDGIGWISIADVPTDQVRITGSARKLSEGQTATEPMIEVPVNKLTFIEG